MKNGQEWIDALMDLPKHPFKWALGKFNGEDQKSWEADSHLFDAAVRRLKVLLVSSAAARSITSLPALEGPTFGLKCDADGEVAITNGEITFVAIAPTKIRMIAAAHNGHTWQNFMCVAKDVGETLDTDVVLTTV